MDPPADSLAVAGPQQHELPFPPLADVACMFCLGTRCLQHIVCVVVGGVGGQLLPTHILCADQGTCSADDTLHAIRAAQYCCGVGGWRGACQIGQSKGRSAGDTLPGEGALVVLWYCKSLYTLAAAGPQQHEPHIP